jgi:hypothetical protein
MNTHKLSRRGNIQQGTRKRDVFQRDSSTPSIRATQPRSKMLLQARSAPLWAFALAYPTLAYASPTTPLEQTTDTTSNSWSKEAIIALVALLVAFLCSIPAWPWIRRTIRNVIGRIAIPRLHSKLARLTQYQIPARLNVVHEPSKKKRNGTTNGLSSTNGRRADAEMHDADIRNTA